MFSETDREVLSHAAAKAAGGRTVLAVAAYGSKVAGYARPDSDYDLIVVVNALRPHAKYVYGEVDGRQFSALVVETEALMKDADAGFLGEFVAGRLLNVYEPIIGSEYLADIESRIKKRVVLEAIDELLERYGAFAEEMLIPPSYFLFNKLKKRAFVYPPVLYSYVKTYSPPVKESNLAASLKGFELVLNAIVAEGFMTRVNGYCVLTKEAEAKIKAPRMAEMLRIAERGIKQYITHGFAGAVGPDTAIKELVSKISRTKKMKELPLELEEPRSLIKLPEGKLVFKSDWLQEALKDLGLKEPYHLTTESMGDFFSTASLYTVRQGELATRLVAKRFQDLWSFKWVVANLMTVTAKQFESKPLTRMTREYRGTIGLRRAGVMTPRVLVVAPDERIMVKEYVTGESLEGLTKRALDGDASALEKVERFGEALGQIHSMNYCLGDSKPSNVLFNAEGIHVVDLEQTEEGGDQPWDIVEYLYYSTITVSSPDQARQLVRVFKKGYLKAGPPENLRRASDSRYAIPFQMLVQPPVVTTIKGELEAS
jgi:tRNA A-37 threonylcarbamoyl transferase component Bud32/predicted nucleotidyltransferase